MSGLRLRLWWESAFWPVPMLGIVAAVLLNYQSLGVDQVLGRSERVRHLVSPSAAIALLAAVGGGMVTFTGFVFSMVLLVLQFGSSQYSPRTVSYFLRTRSIQWVLAVFLMTIVFTFLSVLEVGAAGDATFVPAGSMATAVVLLVLSLGAFLVLLNVVGTRITVDAVLSDLGRRARHQLRRHHRGRGRWETTVLDRVPDEPPGARVLRYAGRAGQVVAIDVRRLVRLADRAASDVEVRIRVGDAVATYSPIALATGDVDDDVLSSCLLVAPERSLRHDPLYALRILTDVSLRALSPSVNDPTTAVRSLDEVEGVLRAAAPLELGTVRISAGAGSVVLRSPSWSDVVDLALLEVVDAGMGQVQVTRRVTALVDDMVADLPETRHEALLRHRQHLRAEVEKRLATDQQVRTALTGDRQGIGGSR